MLGKNPNESQNQVYIEAARVLVQSLKSSGTNADIIVLMLYWDTEIEQVLTSDGAIVKHIHPMKRYNATENFEPWFAEIALAKLRAFELFQYKRVQLLDSDVALVKGKNLDHMFLHSATTKLVSEGLGGDSPLRGGWILLKPSIDDFRNLEAIVNRGKFDQYSGWDYLDLPVDYPGWSSHNHKEKWGFYGSQLEQGMYLCKYLSVVCISA